MSISCRSYLDITAPHFHICNRSSRDEGPLFYQFEAWPVREMVMDHVCRLAREHLEQSGGVSGECNKGERY